MGEGHGREGEGRGTMAERERDDGREGRETRDEGERDEGRWPRGRVTSDEGRWLVCEAPGNEMPRGRGTMVCGAWNEMGRNR